MSGILIKGTIQVQDTNSVVATNTGKLASNVSYVSTIVCITGTETTPNLLATAIENEMNYYLGLNATLLSQNVVHKNPNWTYFLTFAMPV